MNESKPIPVEHHLRLLEAIDQNPEVTQADLAVQLGVAVGTVNWYLKRLISKGYVRIRKMQRRRLLYLITPRGIAEKSRLGILYVQASLHFYRETRAQAIQLLNQARDAGYVEVGVEGNGDLVEICRLTCLEQGLQMVRSLNGNSLPVLRADGTQLKLSMPKQE